MNAKNRNFREVSIDGNTADRHYQNPKTKQFQYEYALYETVSALFESVKCRSMNLESLRLYFEELSKADEIPGVNRKNTQKELLEEVAALVEKDVAGKVSFPMMHICACESQCVPDDDGSHTFIFSDGIYAFSVHIDVPKKGRPKKIKVKNIGKALIIRWR
ncbi:MAG: hypothetical protein K6F73_08485 [Lachnospiraceae bacterium]|nr:hypothetical protein [Lachnospiraceae bacterium]